MRRARSCHGKGTPQKYIAWADTHLPSYGGESLYQFRCRVVHQAMATTPKAPVSRFFFLKPGRPGQIHRIGLGHPAVGVDLVQFVDEISAAVRFWFQAVPETRDLYLRLFEMIQPRPGLSGLIAGVTVIG
jgi:hypothetical protein